MFYFLRQLENVSPLHHQLSQLTTSSQVLSQTHNNIMSTRGDIQKQFSQLMSIVNSQGFKLEDVIPSEVQAHFQDMVALKEARAYIKEVEAREQQLKEDSINLASKLNAKQAELDDQPAEFIALQVDLRQAQIRTDFFKGLANDAEERAARHQRKLAETIQTQTAADDASRKIQLLERDLAERERALLKLLAENRAMVDLHEAQRSQDLKLINGNGDRIIDLINHNSQLEVEKLEAIANSEATTATYDALVKDLEEEGLVVAELVDRQTLRQRDSDKLYAAISTELAPLTHFYNNAFSILNVYQCFFRDLSASGCTAISAMPPALDGLLDAACDNLESFQMLSAAIQIEGLAQGKVRAQVDSMAKSAGQIYTSLDMLKQDVANFVNRSRNNPAQSNTPRQPTSSRIASFTKRFTMG
jgi:hypothetical protein